MTDLFKELSSHPLFTNLLVFAFSLVLILILVRLAQLIATHHINDHDLRYKTRKTFGFGGYMLGLLAALFIFSNQLSNLPVLIGLLGVGLGFSLREPIQSLVGWLVITFGNLYKPGERIKFGGVMGDVMDIGPFATTLMECGEWVKSDLYNGRVVYLPNNLVLREQVLNYSTDFPFLWDEIVIPVRSDSDHHMAREILLNTARRVQADTLAAARRAWPDFMLHHRTEDTPLDMVVTLRFDANWIELTLRYLADYRTRRATEDKLFTAILDAFAGTGGRVRVAAPVLRISELPER